MDIEKALKNQGSKFREDIGTVGGPWAVLAVRKRIEMLSSVWHS